MAQDSKDEALAQIHAAVVDRVTEMVVSVDELGNIVLLNRGAANVLCVPDGSYLGQPFRALLGADPPDVVVSEQVVEYQIADSEGDERRVRGHWVDVLNSDNTRISRLFVGRDYTREHNLQRDLVRSAALAELGLMAAEVAHEVNNPATYLMTNLSILRDDMGGGAFGRLVKTKERQP